MKSLSRLVALPALYNAIAIAELVFPDCVNGPEILTSNLVCDSTASAAERAAALIEAWNTGEKLANLVK
jgi:xylan 1,4-beta-xylosidase